MPPKAWIYHDQVSYEDELETLWGKKWGAEGIGKLKKVALCKPHEYEINPVFEKEPAYYRLYKNKLADLVRWRKFFMD